jgi:putative SOS response-associated peptidase YedK
MCGRFSLVADPDDLREAFPWLNIPITDTAPRYNIAPSQPVAAIPNDGKHQLDYFIWGLIPSWAKDPSIGNRLINARAETLGEKPSFRTAFRRRRCLIPADGFFEWKAVPGLKTKTPMYVRMKSGNPFVFAGLWENWSSPDGSILQSCTIVTTEPNSLMKDIHSRMPVILPASVHEQWLEPGEVVAQRLEALLQPYPAEEMIAYAVSPLVNSPANDLPVCIEPVGMEF